VEQITNIKKEKNEHKELLQKKKFKIKRLSFNFIAAVACSRNYMQGHREWNFMKLE
jgi:hypothetical protein